MHEAAYRRMRRAIAAHVPQDRPLTVVDYGSGTTPHKLGAGTTHRQLLAEMGYDATVIGVDVVERPNVDIVMTQPYRVPLRSGTVDLVISGQVFEHIPMPWASMLEISRLLKPGGLVIVTAPSRGHPHTGIDCWRYYPDAVRALAGWSGLHVVRAVTDFPDDADAPGRRYYGRLTDDDVGGYWGDTIGVLRKPARYSRRLRLVRRPILWWANQAPFVSSFEVEKQRLQRQRARRRWRQRRRERRRARRQNRATPPTVT